MGVEHVPEPPPERQSTPWVNPATSIVSRDDGQFTPGSLAILLPRPPASSALEYAPARSAERHRPEAHCRRASILSPAVTATGTTFWAAWMSGASAHLAAASSQPVADSSKPESALSLSGRRGYCFVFGRLTVFLNHPLRRYT